MDKHARRGMAGSVALVAVLALTGCQQQDEGNGIPPLESASQVSSPAPIPENPVSSSASSPAPIPSVSSSSFPEFEPVTSEQPATDKEATAHAFETVELMYEITSAALRSGDPENADALRVAATGGMLERQQETVTKPLEAGYSYEGETRAELIDSKVFPAARQDGTLIERATVQLVVCQDNTGATGWDKDGKEVGQNVDRRFRVNYDAMWNERSQTWAVVSTSLPKLDGPEETQC